MVIGIFESVIINFLYIETHPTREKRSADDGKIKWLKREEFS